MGTYLFGQTSHDKTTNVKANIIKSTISLKAKNEENSNINHFKLKLKNNTPKF